MSPFVDWFARHTGWVAGVGLLGLALYRLSVGSYDQALSALLAGAAAFGLNVKIDRNQPSPGGRADLSAGRQISGTQ